MNPSHPGTFIVPQTDPNREHFPSIITTTGLTMIGIGSQDESWNLRMSAESLERLSKAGVDVLMFTQSFSEHNLKLVVREQDKLHCIKILGQDLAMGCRLGTTEKVATVSVVGVPDWNQNGIVSHAFEALGKCGTRVIAVAQAASEHSISFCIPQDKVADTVTFLHRELGLD
jgi:aspartokinase